ncbi:MAG: hypothetical protein ACE5DS_00815 [Kiloniellaceae bacterium]
MFRDTAQQAATCRALLALAGLPAVELWTDQGPTDAALRLFVEGGDALYPGGRVLLGLAISLHTEGGGEPLGDAFEHLTPEHLVALSGLLAALAEGHDAVDAWLHNRAAPERFDA